MLARLLGPLAKMPSQSKDADLFTRLHQIAYYSALKHDCVSQGLLDLAAKQAVSLLRYVPQEQMGSWIFCRHNPC